MNLVLRSPEAGEADVCAALEVRSLFHAHREHLHVDDLLGISDPEKAQARWKVYAKSNSRRKKLNVVVAYDDGKPVGFATSGLNVFNRQPWERGQLYSLYVDPEYLRRGIGRELLLHAIRHCEHNIANHMGAEVIQADAGAKQFYQRFGASYVSSGVRRRGHLHPPKVDFFAFKNLNRIMMEKFDFALPYEPLAKKLVRKFVQQL